MNSWRDIILIDFVPNVSKLTIVTDPDNLLTEVSLASELNQRGFDLVEFNDSVEFRYAYESNYRSLWDQGKPTNPVVIVCSQDARFKSVPYDLLQKGRKLSFNLGDLFPKLSYSVIENLDRSLLDMLFDAQLEHSPDYMGDNATKDFILRCVFGIDVELIVNEVKLLRELLRLHYGKIPISFTLIERLTQVISGHGCFNAWPLDRIVSSEDAFFAFLQERWPIFVGLLSKINQIRENPLEFELKYPGPVLLPFDHEDIKVYIDNLFVEGKLTPIRSADIDVEEDSWIWSGIVPTGVDDESPRISKFFDLVEKELPTAESQYSNWIAIALKWAELSSLVHCGSNGGHQSRLKEVGDRLNATFVKWLEIHYSSLINLPPTNPAMLHHVARRLARDLEVSDKARVALIVVDGLALDQWVTVRQYLKKQDKNLVMHESATFAWIPTLTSVSRQSIFSGKPPLFFPSSINSTNSEKKLWIRFWEDHGIPHFDVAYKRGLGDGDASSVLDATIQLGKTKVIGLVIDKVDKIMHGMQLGSAGMHNQIKLWCQSGFIGTLVRLLLKYEYEVWLTADHGNIECNGKGRPAEGVIAETRGERVRVYPTPELRSQVAESFGFAHEWQPIGLPADYFPLVAGGRNAFVNQGVSIVGHGGVAIEEVIVPLVKIERR